MKKFLTMTIAFCTMLACSLACAAAQVTDARWGVDKDNVLRLVVDITENAKYEMKMSDYNKLNLIVDASTNPEICKTFPVKSSLANAMRVYGEGNKTIVELALTKQITDKDFKSFALGKDPINGRPQRIVMDVTADKKIPAAIVSTTPSVSTNVPVIVSTKPTGKRPPIIKSSVKASETVAQANTNATAAPKTEAPKVNASTPVTTKTEAPRVNTPTIATAKKEVAKENIPVQADPKAEPVNKEAPKVVPTKVEANKSETTKVPTKKVDKKFDIKVIANTNKKDTADKVAAPKKEQGLPALKATKKYLVDGGIKGKTIVLDAGHGGSDPGAIGASGLKEKEVTLAITKLIKQELEDKGAKVYMTRTTDVDVYKVGASDRDELQARVNVAEKNNCDAFISIHINAAVNRSAGGFSTHYYPKTDYDIKLARSIQSNLTKNFKVDDRGIREAGFYVVKRSSMPAVLCELLFISNKKEEALLQNTWFRKKSARMIAEGIENYFK